VKALVVDDEALVRSELIYALGRVAADVTVVEAENATQALATLAAGPFDVVFLDIGLPGMNGLDAMTVIGNMPNRPHVVFVTAYDQHALRAFELAANDYVVKPVSEERLALTLARVRGSRAGGEGAKVAAGGRLALEDDDRTLLVRISEIRVVHANGHVVLVRTFDRELRYRGSLAECAGRLEPLDAPRAAGLQRSHAQRSLSRTFMSPIAMNRFFCTRSFAWAT